MSLKDAIDIFAGAASIATAAVAVIAYGGYRYGLWDRRRRLLALLKEQAARHPNPQYIDLQSLTIIRVVTDLRMTEAQAVDAAFSDGNIVVDGIGTQTTFRYAPKISKKATLGSSGDDIGKTEEFAMKSDIGALAAGVIAVAVTMISQPGRYTLINVALSISLVLLILGFAFGKRRSPLQMAAVASVTAMVALPGIAYFYESLLNQPMSPTIHFMAWACAAVIAAPIDWIMSRSPSGTNSN